MPRPHATRNESDNWIVVNPQYQLVVHPHRRRYVPVGILGGITDESIGAILGYLDGAALAAVGQVCRQLRVAASDDAHWLSTCRAEWGIDPSQLARLQTSVTGKDLYQFARQSLRLLTKAMVDEQCMHAMQRTWCLPKQAMTSIAYNRAMFQSPLVPCTMPKPV
ncbi:hypothetical protein SDRG_12822 [Saprolegnia diclina VS20]|uniref:F-box domain-containing protein n=1 Tax=Saprolegnia diclina (strain VS20) TaxID=1156394 RepID=T0RAZ5_SAPDV|nr:hypothetical protein SDRG_12822 [Saprolegnia diclina VS20]EQC29358.1 hypothetical protein SDRG_12822 [Saprolegnia diclina VS20]|eukprot:XP_008617125.1 hypothetical protein SDRG_12822 [Saprolegnia diclina VS20]